MTYKGTFRYPKMLEKVARELAELRSKLSADVYNANTEKYRGSQEKEVSYLGILAELVAQNYLIESEIPFTSAMLVDTKPLPEPDIVLKSGEKLDVKGVKPTATQLWVNHKAHLNSSKNCDFYWFVKLRANYTASHYLVPHGDIDNWQIKELRYTKAFVNNIVRIKQENEDNRVYAS